MDKPKENKLISAAVCSRCHKAVSLRRSKIGKLYLSEQGLTKPHDCQGYEKQNSLFN